MVRKSRETIVMNTKKNLRILIPSYTLGKKGRAG